MPVVKNILSSQRGLSFSDSIKSGSQEIFNYLPRSDYFFTSSGRGGIEYICEKLGVTENDNILLPGFVAQGVILPFQKVGANIEFYKVKSDLRVDLDNFKQKLDELGRIRIAIVIHYFGNPQKDILEIKSLCESANVILIEDCAHSLFSRDETGNLLGSVGDISLFSLTKTLPVPDGAIFFINNKNLLDKKVTYKKSIHHFLAVFFHMLVLYINNYKIRIKGKRIKRFLNILSDIFYWKFYYRLTIKMPKPANISGISLRLLSTFDYDYIINRKVEMFNLMSTNLKNNGIRPMYENPIASPVMGLVLLVNNRDKLAEFIRRRLNVHCLVFKKRWDYINKIPDKEQWYEYCSVELTSDHLNERNFIAKHIVLPIVHNFPKVDTRLITEKIYSLIK